MSLPGAAEGQRLLQQPAGTGLLTLGVSDPSEAREQGGDRCRVADVADEKQRLIEQLACAAVVAPRDRELPEGLERECLAVVLA